MAKSKVLPSKNYIRPSALLLCLVIVIVVTLLFYFICLSASQVTGAEPYFDDQAAPMSVVHIGCGEGRSILGKEEN